MDHNRNNLIYLWGSLTFASSQSQHYRQTYKVFKSMSMLALLQGDEAVSNVIKLALILEDGSL